MAKDVVCGMEVNEKKAVAKIVHKGKTYYFCNLTCQWAFQKNLEQFIKK